MRLGCNKEPLTRLGDAFNKQSIQNGPNHSEDFYMTPELIFLFINLSRRGACLTFSFSWPSFQL
jgi:hypothetical protein